MQRSFLIYLSLWNGTDGLTIVLMTDYPDEKKNVKRPCPFLGTLLPLVVKDVGRMGP